MISRIDSSIATKLSWNAFSVSVSVSASELANSRSIAADTSAVRSGLSTSTMNAPMRSASRGKRVFSRSVTSSQWK